MRRSRAAQCKYCDAKLSYRKTIARKTCSKCEKKHSKKRLKRRSKKNYRANPDLLTSKWNDDFDAAWDNEDQPLLTPGWKEDLDSAWEARRNPWFYRNPDLLDASWEDDLDASLGEDYLDEDHLLASDWEQDLDSALEDKRYFRNPDLLAPNWEDDLDVSFEDDDHLLASDWEQDLDLALGNQRKSCFRRNPEMKYDFQKYLVPDDSWDDCECETDPCVICHGTGKKYPFCHQCSMTLHPQEEIFISLNRAESLCPTCYASLEETPDEDAQLELFGEV